MLEIWEMLVGTRTQKILFYIVAASFLWSTFILWFARIYSVKLFEFIYFSSLVSWCSTPQTESITLEALQLIKDTKHTLNEGQFFVDLVNWKDVILVSIRLEDKYSNHEVAKSKRKSADEIRILLWDGPSWAGFTDEGQICWISIVNWNKFGWIDMWNIPNYLGHVVNKIDPVTHQKCSVKCNFTTDR